VPLAQLSEFRFVPEISGDLRTWFGADSHPDYFLLQSTIVDGEIQFSVERGTAWPGGNNQIFLRLRIERA